MATSKLQRAVSQALSVEFGEYTIRENSRPAWCISQTGARLELDFFIEELAVAVEVQGQQHFQFVEKFHGDIDGFYAQQQRDQDKTQACNLAGVLLLEVVTAADIQPVVDRITDIKTGAEIKNWRLRHETKHGKNWPLKLRQWHREARPFLKTSKALSADEVVLLRRLQHKITQWVAYFGVGIFHGIDDELIQEVMKCARQLGPRINNIGERSRIEKARRSRRNNRRNRKARAVSKVAESIRAKYLKGGAE